MNTLDKRKAEQLVKQWSQQAERRFANADQEVDARNKQFIEHGAVIYANCAAALDEIITAKDHPDPPESHPGTIQATDRQIQRYVARFEAIQSRLLARRSCSEVYANTDRTSYIPACLDHLRKYFSKWKRVAAQGARDQLNR